MMGGSMLIHNVSRVASTDFIEAITFVASFFCFGVGISFLLPYYPYMPMGGGTQIVGYFLAAVAGAPLIPVIVLLSIATVSFGPDLGLLAAIFEFSAEAAPPGAIETYHLSDAPSSGLAHSSLLESLEVHEEISKWMIKRAAGQPAEAEH
jgi:hypothetical protein